MALRARKVSGAFDKRGPGRYTSKKNPCSPPSLLWVVNFCKRFQWQLLTLHLSLIAVRPFVSKKKGSDEELMTHSEDEHEVDVVANKG